MEQDNVQLCSYCGYAIPNHEERCFFYNPPKQEDYETEEDFFAACKKKRIIENQSQEQDNVKGGEFGDAYFKVKKIVAHAWRSAANAYLMYPNNKHTFFDYWSDLGKDFSKELQIQITSLEASNNFHKQQAHEAINEQYRLQKENEWISTKEKLPENAETVLCLSYHGRIISNSYSIGADQDTEWFKKSFSHWRPLPPKP